MKFPQYYRPRAYQAELHKMWRDYKIGIAVLPRQSGKDVAMAMEMCERRLRYPKTNGVYVSLDNNMIRGILWDKTYFDPTARLQLRLLQDNVPEGQAAWKNTMMEGRFKNGALLKLQGFYQSGEQKGGVGTSYLDYAFTELALFQREDPIPLLMPIIDSNQGVEDKKLMIVSTPRGKRQNALWQAMSMVETRKDAKVIHYTIEDLNAMQQKAGLPPVVSKEQLEITRQMYFKRFGNDRMFEQEYYCSFETMDAAAVYGAAIEDLRKEGRVENFNLNAGHPVYVVFDIGASGSQSDATSWIVFQWYNGRLFLYDCGEGHGRALPEYIDVLREKPYFNRIERVILPWDAESHERAISQTPADMVRQKFPNVSVLARSTNVYRAKMDTTITDIQATRLALYNTIIHKDYCDWLLECLENYKYAYNEKDGVYSDKPKHDRFSHLMDALRYAVQSTKELDFFSGSFGDTTSRGGSYEEDWSKIW